MRRTRSPTPAFASRSSPHHLSVFLFALILLGKSWRERGINESQENDSLMILLSVMPGCPPHSYVVGTSWCSQLSFARNMAIHAGGQHGFVCSTRAAVSLCPPTSWLKIARPRKDQRAARRPLQA